MALDRQTLDELLNYLEKTTDQLATKQITVDKLTHDEDLLPAVEHRLQTAVECVINIAEHIVSGLNLGHEETAKDTIYTLAKNKIIPQDLADRLADATDMRNVLVHLYFKINLEKVVKAATEDLDDLRQFAKAVNEFLEKQNKQNPYS